MSFGLKKDLSYQRELPTVRELQIELLFSWFGQSITGHEDHFGLTASVSIVRSNDLDANEIAVRPIATLV